MESIPDLPSLNSGSYCLTSRWSVCSAVCVLQLISGPAHPGRSAGPATHDGVLLLPTIIFWGDRNTAVSLARVWV